MREFQPQMIADIAQQPARAVWLRHDVAPKMSVDEARDEPNALRRDENPGGPR